MKIESPAFAPGAHIPEPYSRYGENQSPPLVFRDVPAQAKSLALIVEDLDAPKGTFTHWIVFNLEPTAEGLEEGSRNLNARQGKNGWGQARYGGPRLPDGEHRYFFRLFALDQKLDCADGCLRAEIERAMSGHIVAEAELMGRFATSVQAERDEK